MINKQLLLNPDFWRMILDIAPGVRNAILYLLKMENIHLPYIPVPGIRQIIYFFNSDEILKKHFSRYLKNPYKNIDYLKKVYLLLNYSGNIHDIEREIPELPKNYLLNRALENIGDFGIISLKLEQIKKKLKSISQFEIKELLKELKSIKNNEAKLKELWENSKVY